MRRFSLIFVYVACMMLMMVMMADEKHDDIFFSIPPNRTAQSSRNLQCLLLRRMCSKLRSVAVSSSTILTKLPVPFAAQNPWQAKKRRRFACCCSGFIGTLRARVAPNRRAPPARRCRLSFRATMAGDDSEPAGFFSQLSALVLAQDFLLLRL